VQQVIEQSLKKPVFGRFFDKKAIKETLNPIFACYFIAPLPSK